MTNANEKAHEYALVTGVTVGAVGASRSKEIYALAAALDAMPESEPLGISHEIHAGVYSRTTMLPAGRVCCGAMLKIPTQLIVSGRCRIVAGAAVDVDGYQVLRGLPGRQVVVYAFADTWLTCLWATTAKTVREAELEAVGEEQVAFLKENT